MPCTMERLLELRADAFSDDVAITDEMCEWTEERAVSYFENGGVTDISDRTPPPPATQPLRILSFHGGGANKALNAMQMARLKGALVNAKVDYLEGTRKWKDENIDPMLRKMFGDGPYYGWYGVENDSIYDMHDAMNYVNAMMDPSVNFTYLEYDEALDRVEAHMQANGPYDVLAGFSQGAIMITMLTARTLQRGKKPSWKCNVLLSALPPRASPYAPIFPRGEGLGNPMHIVPPIGAAIPCVACMGERDQYFKYGQQGLKSIYGPSLKWFEHTGGHETAKDPEVNGRLADAIWRAVGFEPPSRAEWAKAQVPRS